MTTPPTYDVRQGDSLALLRELPTAKGYSFIGFELHQHYADLALERITAAFEQRPRQAAIELDGDLFAGLAPG